MRSPCNKTVFFPVGAFNANWSKVRISPPAFKMRALAPDVTRNAQTYKKMTINESLIQKVKKLTYSDFGHFVQPFVVNYGSDDDSNAFFIGLLGHVLGDGAQGYWRTVDAGHEQTSQYDFVEMRSSSTGQITVQLHGQCNKSQNKKCNNLELFVKSKDGRHCDRRNVYVPWPTVTDTHLWTLVQSAWLCGRACDRCRYPKRKNKRISRLWKRIETDEKLTILKFQSVPYECERVETFVKEKHTRTHTHGLREHR